MENVFIYIQYLILSIVVIRIAYYFVKAVTQGDSFAYQGMVINLLFSAAIIVLIHLVGKEESDLLIYIVAVVFDLMGCIYFGFFYVNKAEKDYDKYFDLKYAKSFLEFYEIDVDSFKEKSYEEQLEIINNAYIVNCDSGMAEYMVDKNDEDDLKDTLDILEPLLNKGE